MDSMEEHPPPSSFSTLDKLCNLEVAVDKLSVRYIGAAQPPHEAGAIKANRPFPRNVRVAYFEVTIISRGASGEISVGLVDKDFPMCRQLGRDDGSISYGYIGKDGKKWSKGSSAPYGPPLEKGDVVGCGIRFHAREIFYCRNGKYLGTAFRDVKGTFFPAVSLHSKGEHISVNFGQQPMRFPVHELVRDERVRILSALPSYDVSVGEVSQLVAGYLMHSGYSETLKLFLGTDENLNANGFEADQRDEMLPHRAAVRQCIISGDIDGALECLRTHFPSFFSSTEKSGTLLSRKALFRLRCQHFVEMIRAEQSSEAIDFARNNFQPVDDEDMRFQEDVLALLAYANPSQPSCPVVWLLDTHQRDLTASHVNAALLAMSDGSACYSSLERLMRQMQCTRVCMRELRGNTGDVFSLAKLIQCKRDLSTAPL